MYVHLGERAPVKRSRSVSRMLGTAPTPAPRAPGEPTVLASWTETLVLTLDDLGLHGRAMAEDAGIDVATFDEPGARLPLSATSRLWRRAVEATGDESLGILVSRYVRPTTFHGLSQAVVTSPSVREALERMAHAARVVADGAKVETTCHGSTLELVNSWTDPATHPTFESIDAVIASIVRAARFIAGRDFSPIEVWLERPAPSNPERFHQFFGCTVHFDAGIVRLVFDLSSSERKARTANPELAQAIDSVVAQYLQQLDVAGSFTGER